MFNRKKKNITALAESFGQPKNEHFNFRLIKRYFERKKHNNQEQVLEDQTCADLDFDLFFEKIDRTTSKVGQQYLYEQLRCVRQKDTYESILEYFTANSKKRLEAQHLLSKLNNDQSYYLADLFQTELSNKPKWHFIVPLLSLLSFSCIVLGFFIPSYFVLLLILFPVLAGIHYFNKIKVNVYVNSIPQLLVLNNIAKKLAKMPVFDSIFKDIKPSIKVIDQIKKRIAIFKLEQKIDSDLEIIYWFLLEIIKITFLLEPLLLFSILDTIKTKRKELEEVYSAVGEADMILSVLSLREGISWCPPQMNSEYISFESMTHPLVDDCIPNSFTATQPFLLTGSNMSGKTTFIRAIGLNYLTGVTLNTCFAAKAEFPFMQLHSVIRISDDVSTSSSYFFQEVNSINNILTQIGSKGQHLILLDELFKGTNTSERIASAKAVLSYLEKRNCFVFVSTHDYELVSLLEKEYSPYYFNERIQDQNIHFDYTLKQGVPDKGNAIKILEFNGFPMEITNEANRIVQLDKNKAN